MILNNSAVLEFNRNKRLSPAQKKSLQLMDTKLDQGITLRGQFLAHPTLEQRIEFVATNLTTALLNENDTLAAASCAYMATALPELKQIKATEKNTEVTIELILDREYQKEIKMNYLPLDKITTQH